MTERDLTGHVVPSRHIDLGQGPGMILITTHGVTTLVTLAQFRHLTSRDTALIRSSKRVPRRVGDQTHAAGRNPLTCTVQACRV